MSRPFPIVLLIVFLFSYYSFCLPLLLIRLSSWFFLSFSPISSLKSSFPSSLSFASFLLLIESQTRWGSCEIRINTPCAESQCHLATVCYDTRNVRQQEEDFVPMRTHRPTQTGRQTENDLETNTMQQRTLRHLKRRCLSLWWMNSRNRTQLRGRSPLKIHLNRCDVIQLESFFKWFCSNQTVSFFSYDYFCLLRKKGRSSN